MNPNQRYLGSDKQSIFESFVDQFFEEFHVKATSDSKEIKELIEVGFQYVCEKDGLIFFRKRK